MSKLTYYDVTNLKIEFCPDKDPALSFYKLTLFTPGNQRGDEIVIFPNDAAGADAISARLNANANETAL
jgi:hypothetical protein